MWISVDYVCVALLAQVLKTSFDAQAKLRALIALGSLVSVTFTSTTMPYTLYNYIVQILVNRAMVVSSVLPDSLTALVESHCSPTTDSSQVGIYIHISFLAYTVYIYTWIR